MSDESIKRVCVCMHDRDTHHREFVNGRMVWRACNAAWCECVAFEDASKRDINPG